VNSLGQKSRFLWLGEVPKRAATREGEGDACPINAMSRLEDVLSGASRVEPGRSAPRIPARSSLAGFISMWTLGGTAFWSCWAYLEPCCPWIPHRGSYILAWHRVRSALDLNRSSPRPSRHYFTLIAKNGLLCISPARRLHS
jgi:hypothetical protein